MESHCIVVVHFIFTFAFSSYILLFTFAVQDIIIRILATFPVLVTQLKRKKKKGSVIKRQTPCHGQNGEVGNSSYTQETI